MHFLASPFKSLHFYLWLFILCSYGSSLTIKDFEIYDLEFNTNDFVSEVSQWQSSTTNPYNEIYTSCSGIYLLGGFEVTWTPNIQFQRTYESLRSHHTVFLTIDFWLLGSWDVFDSITIQAFNSTTLSFSHTMDPVIPPAKWTSITCDDTDVNNFMPLTVLAQFPHSDNSLSLNITCQSQYLPGEGLALCGFRNIKILFSSHIKNTNVSVLKSSGLANFLSSISRECFAGSYKDNTTQTCDACDAKCENCFNQSSGSCLSCKKNFFYNGIQCANCHFDCLTCLGPADNQCLSCENGKFLHRNGTCSSFCDKSYSQRIIAGVQHCEFPCNKDQYLYPDGSCLSSCSFPMLERDSPDGKYCESPCNDPSNYYYPIEEFCQTTCSDPYSSSFKRFYLNCYIPLMPETLDYAIYISGGIATIGLTMTSIVSMSDPMAILTGVISMMSHYVKYLNVTYSVELEKRFILQDSSSISMDFWMHRSNLTDEEFESSPVPYIFKKRKLHPSFIENIFPDLLILIIFTGIFIGFRASEWIYYRLRRKQISTIIIRKIRMRAQNFLITILYVAYPNILFFSILDFKSPRNRDNLDGLSAFIFSILVLMGIRILWMHLNIIRKQREMVDTGVIVTPDDFKKFDKKNKAMQVLFKGFEDDIFPSQIFLVVFMGRAILFILVITLLNLYPLIQSISLVVLSLSMLLYLWVYSPFKSKIQRRIQIGNELLLLVINSAVLAIARLDSLHETENDIRNKLGILIISIYIFSNFLAVIYVILALFIQKFYKQTEDDMENVPLRFEINAQLSQSNKVISPDTQNVFKGQHGNEGAELDTMDRPPNIDDDKNFYPIHFLSAKTKDENLSVSSEESKIEDPDTQQKYNLENISDDENEQKAVELRPSLIEKYVSSTKEDPIEIVKRNSPLLPVSPVGLDNVEHQKATQAIILSKSFKRTNESPSKKPLRIGYSFNDLMRIESHHDKYDIISAAIASDETERIKQNLASEEFQLMPKKEQ